MTISNAQASKHLWKVFELSRVVKATLPVRASSARSI